MFKNLLCYRIRFEQSMTPQEMEERLARQPFAPCGPTQEKSFGWVPPRGIEHAALVETAPGQASGQRILRFQVEKKSVPGAIVKRRAAEAAQAIEAREGRKPGKREVKELQEEALRELLPQAFPKTASVLVWIDEEHGILTLDAGSAGAADEVITSLVKQLEAVRIEPLETACSPKAAMLAWLTAESADAWPAGFAPGRHVELQSEDDDRAFVKYDRHVLDDAQMRLHIQQGKHPRKLSLTYEDRVSFVLTETLALKKIRFLDDVERESDESEDAFDADLMLCVSELRPLLHELIEALNSQGSEAQEAELALAA